ncbi:MAG: hypothetical protein J6K58_13800 [Lachnospiraceae bacterium]|nr:hypothetical protein [Lachnospiraceae bacterium]
MLCCRLTTEASTKDKLMKNFVVIKEYDPCPRNKDGSIRWFLYRWDDGKSGVRRLVRCRHCGSFFLIQAYHLNKFSKYAAYQFEDWYPIENEKEADRVNDTYTGLQWELQHKPAVQCADDKILD